MKLAVVGSRGFPDRNEVRRYLNNLDGGGIVSNIGQIISGGAAGPDTWAQEWAKENGIPFMLYPAQWDLYGKRAGAIRNDMIVKAADWVTAFWDGVSPGTRITIDLALKHKKRLTVIFPEARPPARTEE